MTEKNNVVYVYATYCRYIHYIDYIIYINARANQTTFNKNTHKMIYTTSKDQDEARNVTQRIQQTLRHNNKSVIINLFSEHSCKYYQCYHLK